jgi:curved DNA-binding protein CbpA
MTVLRPDYYALLGVGSDADRETIRAAYHAFAKQYHPDSGGVGQASERFLQVQEAYRVLGNADRRTQYDVERARQQALEEARRLEREISYRRSLVPVPSVRQPTLPPRGLRANTGWLYVVAIAAVVAALGAIIAQRRADQSQHPQMTVVKIDNGYRPDPLDAQHRAERDGAGLPSDLAALSREMDRLSRLRAERAEQARAQEAAEAKARAEAQAKAAREKAESASAMALPSGTDEAVGRQIECSGEGRRFVVIRQHDAVSISYNGGPLSHPVVHDSGTGMIVVSGVEPSNRISIGFMKGYKDGTVLLVSDAAGNVFRTIGLDCSGAAF